MWWKILIAIVCAVLLISPVDFMPALPFDDIVYGLGMVTTLLTTFKNLNKGKPSHSDSDVNDVDDN